MRKVRDLVRETIGMENPAVYDVKGAEKMFKILEGMGVRVTRKDGTPFDVRFLRKSPDFIDMANLAIQTALDLPVRENS